MQQQQRQRQRRLLLAACVDVDVNVGVNVLSWTQKKNKNKICGARLRANKRTNEPSAPQRAQESKPSEPTVCRTVPKCGELEPKRSE